MRTLIITLGLLVVAGCVYEQERFDLYAATTICDVEALGQERASTITRLNKWKRSLAPLQNGYSNTGLTEERASDTLQMIDGYAAEIEVGYRSISSSCRLLSRCMEVNRHDERLCTTALAQYDDSQQRFAELIAYERTIVDEAKKTLQSAGSPPPPRRGRGRARGVRGTDYVQVPCGPLGLRTCTVPRER